MIDVAISYGFGGENRYNLPKVPESIQLALYKYELYEKYKDELIKAVHDSGARVPVIHLPIDSLRRDIDDTIDIIKMGVQEFGCVNYVIHPNKFIQGFVDQYLKTPMKASNGHSVKLCIENFQWRKNKVYRSPLQIIERLLNEGEYDKRQFLGMVFDTSHTEEIWFDHRILPFILKHTNVIHLSNRAKGLSDHMPFNDPRGKLNLMQFVNDLKRRYKWNGVIVLEYMEQYQDKLLKNYELLKRLVS